MPKMLILDDVKVRGLTLILGEDGALKVEATYFVLASGKPILTKTADITPLVPGAALTNLKALFPQAKALILPVETT